MYSIIIVLSRHVIFEFCDQIRIKRFISEAMKLSNFSSLIVLQLLIFFLSCSILEAYQTKNHEASEPSKKDDAKPRDRNSKSNEKSHILMYHPWGTKSHRGQQNALINGLLDRGHIITGVFADESNLNHENYTEIIIETRYFFSSIKIMYKLIIKVL